MCQQTARFRPLVSDVMGHCGQLVQHQLDTSRKLGAVLLPAALTTGLISWAVQQLQLLRHM